MLEEIEGLGSRGKLGVERRVGGVTMIYHLTPSHDIHTPASMFGASPQRETVLCNMN